MQHHHFPVSLLPIIPLAEVVRYGERDSARFFQSREYISFGVVLGCMTVVIRFLARMPLMRNLLYCIRACAAVYIAACKIAKAVDAIVNLADFSV